LLWRLTDDGDLLVLQQVRQGIALTRLMRAKDPTGSGHGGRSPWPPLGLGCVTLVLPPRLGSCRFSGQAAPLTAGGWSVSGRGS
jgi:hypothetical protein